MSELYTREQLAFLLSVHPVTIDAWLAQGMPQVYPGTAGPSDAAEGPRRMLVTRRELARFFGVSDDRVTKWLPDGLGAALVVSGGRGRESFFWLPAAVTWDLARHDQLSQQVLEDFKARAAAGVRITADQLARLAPDRTTDVATPRRKAPKAPARTARP